MPNFNDYIKTLRADGKLAFTTEQALSDLGISSGALYAAVHKLKKKGELVSPVKHLYVMVPPEYQAIGCLTPEELIPILMKYWKLDYYVSLLSAAHYHGASHQKAQTFQVMVAKQIKTIVCGHVKIEFIYKKSLANLPIESRVVKTGYLKISSPELTMMDLLTYPNRCGGLNHIATLLSELIEAIKPKALTTLMQQSKEKAWMQRSGYILEHIDTMEEKQKEKNIKALQKYLKKTPLSPIRLAPEVPRNNALLNKKWFVIENTTVESDL